MLDPSSIASCLVRISLAFVRHLDRLRERRAPSAVRTAAAAGWCLRWWGLFNVTAQRALCRTLLAAPRTPPPRPSALSRSGQSTNYRYSANKTTPQPRPIEKSNRHTDVLSLCWLRYHMCPKQNTMRRLGCFSHTCCRSMWGTGHNPKHGCSRSSMRAKCCRTPASHATTRSRCGPLAANSGYRCRMRRSARRRATPSESTAPGMRASGRVRAETRVASQHQANAMHDKVLPSAVLWGDVGRIGACEPLLWHSASLCGSAVRSPGRARFGVWALVMSRVPLQGAAARCPCAL